MKLRIIAVQAGNEIKKFPNDTRHFFFLQGYFTDCRQL